VLAKSNYSGPTYIARGPLFELGNLLNGIVGLATVTKVRQISEHPKIRVDSAAQLWRYVPLSSLFLNLAGKIYIPTIKELQESDPKEGLSAISPEWIIGYLSDRAPEKLEAIISSLPEESRNIVGLPGPHTIADLQYNSRLIADRWDKNETESKCAWCWHCSSHESAAMWKLYGEAGVAVQTTVRHIESLPSEITFEIGRIQYCNKETGEAASVNPEALQNQELLTQSYFFKSHDYEFEAEVRLIIDAIPFGTSRLIENVDATKLIQRIVLSPWTHIDEFEALKEVITRICPGVAITRSTLLQDPDDEKTKLVIERGFH
jgi:hypothetical protein